MVKFRYAFGRRYAVDSLTHKYDYSVSYEKNGKYNFKFIKARNAMLAKKIAQKKFRIKNRKNIRVERW